MELPVFNVDLKPSVNPSTSLVFGDCAGVPSAGVPSACHPVPSGQISLFELAHVGVSKAAEQIVQVMCNSAIAAKLQNYGP